MPKHRRDGNGTQKRKFQEHFIKKKILLKKVKQIKNIKLQNKKFYFMTAHCRFVC